MEMIHLTGHMAEVLPVLTQRYVCVCCFAGRAGWSAEAAPSVWAGAAGAATRAQGEVRMPAVSFLVLFLGDCWTRVQCGLRVVALGEFGAPLAGSLVTCVSLLCAAAVAAGRCSIVRELHVYGSAVAVHARDTGKLQHQGYGSLLMAAAERIALQVCR